MESQEVTYIRRERFDNLHVCFTDTMKNRFIVPRIQRGFAPFFFVYINCLHNLITTYLHTYLLCPVYFRIFGLF